MREHAKLGRAVVLALHHHLVLPPERVPSDVYVARMPLADADQLVRLVAELPIAAVLHGHRHTAFRVDLPGAAARRRCYARAPPRASQTSRSAARARTCTRSIARAFAASRRSSPARSEPMKKLFLVAVPLGLAVLVVSFLLSGSRERADAYDARLERARLKRDFSERAGAARTIPADRLPEWRDEVAALSRWYFDELQAIRNRHPAEPARPSGVEAAAADRKGSSTTRRAPSSRTSKYADGRLAPARGRYAPVQSMIAEGLRLDLLAVEAGAPPRAARRGSGSLRAGSAPFVEREKGSERTTVVRNVVPVSFKRIAFHFLDAAGKPYGEMSSGGEPYQKLSIRSASRTTSPRAFCSARGSSSCSRATPPPSSSRSRRTSAARAVRCAPRRSSRRSRFRTGGSSRPAPCSRQRCERRRRPRRKGPWRRRSRA